jgi:UDP-N-acetyl-D-glucosamine dehydrogenase
MKTVAVSRDSYPYRLCRVILGEFRIEARFTELAGHVNSQMPHSVMEKIQGALNDCQPLKGSSMRILRVAYKRDLDDTRESPALDIVHLLPRRGARVSFSDPYVTAISVDGAELLSTRLDGALGAADCAVIITDHTNVDYETLLKKASLVVDARNALRGVTSERRPSGFSHAVLLTAIRLDEIRRRRKE